MGLLDLIKKPSGSVGPSVAKAMEGKPVRPAAKAEVGKVVRQVRQPIAVAELPAASRAKAAERLRFVRLVQSVKRQQRLSDPDAVALVAATRCEDFPILVRAGKNGSSALIYNNYRNWGRLIRECANDADALAMIADQYQKGTAEHQKNVKEERENDPFWEVFYKLYLHDNHLYLADAYRKAVKTIREHSPERKVPSISQVRYAVSKIDPAAVILAREGEVAYKNRCGDFIQRNWTDIPAGYCVIGDSRDFDTRVRVWDENTKKWKAARPKITALIDARSWYFAAYWITTEPVNSDMLINTLALYCRNTGGEPPAVAYFDNGKDYCAQGFSTPLEVEGYQHSIFQELGIRLQNATPYNGRAKTIERAFRDIRDQFDKMFPDYLGSTPAERSSAAEYTEKHPELLPSTQQFCELFVQFLTEYHNTPKKGKIHGGKSPKEIWEQREHRQSFSPEQLRFAFLKPEGVRQVKRGPSVAFGNLLFYCDSVQVGEKVLVKSDPLDPTHVFLFTFDGRLRGEARTRAAISALADDADQEVLKSLIARQRKQLAEARTTLHNLTGGREQVSPLEILLAPVDAKPQLLGTKSSVKGHVHSYRHYALPGVITAPELEFQEDKKQKQLADFGETVAPKETEEPSSSKEALSSFNEFMTSRHRDDDF